MRVKHILVGFLEGLQVSLALSPCNLASQVCNIQLLVIRIGLVQRKGLPLTTASGFFVVEFISQCRVSSYPLLVDDLVVDALVELVLIDLQLVGEQVPFLIDLSEFDEHDVTDLSDSRNSTQGWDFFPGRS